MPDKIIFCLPETIIDIHCHARDFKQAYKTTVEQTLIEAKAGLIRISGLMPNTDDPIITCYRLDLLLDYIDRACAKHHITEPQYVWFGATDDNLKECQQALQYSNVLGIKIYSKAKNGATVTTGTIGVSNDSIIEANMDAAKEAGKAVAVHCDDPEIIAKYGYIKEAEVAYVNKIIRLGKKVPGVKIVFCHVSCQESAESIIKARKEGLDAILELCPHYLWFDAEGHNWNPELDPVFYQCFNNLRTSADREFLVGLLSDPSVYAIVSSDNAPHTRKEKIEKRLGGLPSNQHMVKVLITLAAQNGIPENRVADLLCYNAARAFNIPVSDKKTRHILNEQVDRVSYNNDIVENPWRGSKFLVPSLWC